MRQLFIFSDGTWNTPEQSSNGMASPTNIVKLYNALAEQTANGIQQIRYYHPGVGTSGSRMEKYLGGVAGQGLCDDIMSAYKWLGDNYQPGDQIYLFGFSRGAFAVRSLVGFIRHCGLLNTSELTDENAWRRIKTAFNHGYRAGNHSSHWLNTAWQCHTVPSESSEISAENGQIPIHFMGVFDTVGALGIPNHYPLIRLLDPARQYGFLNTKLSHSVHHARHALAIDERRPTFAPTLWDNVASHPDAMQCWFPGAHSDVGGGQTESQLSDGALLWMLEQAELYGAAFSPAFRSQIQPHFQGPIHNNSTGKFQFKEQRPRTVPDIGAQSEHQLFHPSAIDRFNSPPISQAPYWGSLRLDIKESAVFTIHAAKKYNATQLYCQQGETYRFQAEGQWLQGKQKSNAKGIVLSSRPWAAISLWKHCLFHLIQKTWRILLRNPLARFPNTRRINHGPWMCLQGEIANGDAVNVQTGQPEAHETFYCGDGLHQVKKDGYFYAFANDAWENYPYNRGHIRLTITRVS